MRMAGQAGGQVEVLGIVRAVARDRRCLDLVGEAKNTWAMDESERRKWRRLEHDLRVQLQSLGERSGRPLTAIGTHLSPDGIFVQVGDPPPEDTRVRVTIGGDEAGSLQLTAEGVVTNQFAPTDARDVTPTPALHGASSTSFSHKDHRLRSFRNLVPPELEPDFYALGGAKRGCFAPLALWSGVLHQTCRWRRRQLRVDKSCEPGVHARVQIKTRA